MKINKEISFCDTAKRSFKIGKDILFGDFVFMFLISIFFSIFPVVGVWINKELFTTLELIIKSKGKIEDFFILIIIYGIYILISKSHIIFYKRYYLQYGALLKFEKRVKYILHNKCAEISLENYEKPQLYNYARQAQNASINIYRIIEVIIEILACIIGTIVMGVYISGFNPLFLIFVILAVIPNLSEKIYDTKQKVFYRDYMTQISKEEEAYRETIDSDSFFKETRVLSAVPYLKKIWKNIFNDMLNIEWKMSRKLGLYKVLASLLKTVGNAGGFFLSAILFMNGQINLGEFTASTAAFTYLSNFSSEFFSLLGYFSMFSMMVKPFFGFMDIKNDERKSNKYNFNSFIKLKNVSFKYPGTDEYVLKDIKFDIKKGEKIAIVGRNGSGKTTLTNIILGLYSPISGKVEYDSNNINEIQEKILFKDKSAVFQNFNKYYLTIKENIALSDVYNEKDDKLILKSLQISGLDYLYKDKDEILGRTFDGKELSGGEWQKLAISRGFYRTSDIVVLDEPTSAIDPIQETSIYDSFMKLLENKTGIIVTHRLGAIKLVDRIIVLDNGTIVEEGTHDELLKNNNLYARLWNSQVVWYDRQNSV